MESKKACTRAILADPKSPLPTPNHNPYPPLDPQQSRHFSPLVFGSSRLTLTRASRNLRAKKRDTVAAGTGQAATQHGRGDTRGATAAERVFKAPQVGEAVDLRILAPLGANESVGGDHVVT